MSAEPEKRKPEGTNVGWVAEEVGWEIPTWFASDLYGRGDGAQILLVLNDLAVALRKAEAAGTDTAATIRFKWWRKPTPRARKNKPVGLRATLYMHPEYTTMWMLVEYDKVNAAFERSRSKFKNALKELSDDDSD